jgi:hypothetical protein
MKKMCKEGCKLNTCALAHAVGVVIYVFLVALIMSYGEKLFGNQGSLIAIVTFLLLFVLSAAVVGGLIFAQPVMMYLDDKKKEAIKMLIQTITWLFVIVIIFLMIMALV